MGVGCKNFEKAFDRVNKEPLLKVLRVYDVGGEQLNSIKSMYANSLPCVRANEGESECFTIDGGGRQGFIMSSWLFSVCLDAVMKEVNIGMGKIGVRFLGKGREGRLRGLLYADDLVLCSQSERDMKTMVERFVEVCSRRSLIVNGEKSEVKALGREEGSIYKDLVEGARLDHVSELKNMCGCVLDESGTDCAECRRKLESGREDNGMEGEGKF